MTLFNFPTVVSMSHVGTGFTQSAEAIIEYTRQNNVVRLAQVLEQQQQQQSVDMQPQQEGQQEVFPPTNNEMPVTSFHGAKSGGRTALHFACQRGNTEVVALLLDFGADINAHSFESGVTPLMELCGSAEHPHLVRTFVAAGVDIEARDWCGRTAFMHALTSYNAGPAAEETIRILIEAGCNINHLDYAGISAFGLMMYSCNEWMIPVIGFLERGARTDRSEDLNLIDGDIELEKLYEGRRVVDLSRFTAQEVAYLRSLQQNVVHQHMVM